MINRVFTIIAKDIKVELRQKHAIGGIFLFAGVCVFVVFKAFNKFTGFEWNLLLWIITLFTGINAIVKSFLQESRGTYLYYYTLLRPAELLVARLLYNFFLLLLLFVIITLLMILFGGNPIQDYSFFLLSSSLGLIGISAVFTMVSSLASAGGNSSTLMSIMALPCVLPILLTLIQTTAVSFRLIQKSSIDQDLIILAGIDGLIIGVSLLLFPAVWKA